MNQSGCKRKDKENWTLANNLKYSVDNQNLQLFFICDDFNINSINSEEDVNTFFKSLCSRDIIFDTLNKNSATLL